MWMEVLLLKLVRSVQLDKTWIPWIFVVFFFVEFVCYFSFYVRVKSSSSRFELRTWPAAWMSTNDVCCVRYQLDRFHARWRYQPVEGFFGITNFARHFALQCLWRFDSNRLLSSHFLFSFTSFSFFMHVFNQFVPSSCCSVRKQTGRSKKRPLFGGCFVRKEMLLNCHLISPSSEYFAEKELKFERWKLPFTLDVVDEKKLEKLEGLMGKIVNRRLMGKSQESVRF